MPDMTFWPDPDDVHNLRIETITGEDIASVILHGEADISTLRELETALERVELDGATSVRLDVSDLHFADAGAIRQLTIFAKQATQAGYHIETCGVNPTLRKMVRLLEVDDDLRLT